ncbi:glycosyltransferase [Salimicrobium album]|uniref:Glycosyltransferase involved in cell wall bisynthesis n=1 Tax=Salimicrobium album TaxID=50717 RepID=A0A1H3EKW2_9BACI|nr:glycosyltransferase [Salimicrobium album]SDX79240.1 Glycosyltransferase involved in cell wall bisynthesis [Salimicrobium album]
MKKVIHIITGLGSGGAENMLYKLVKYSNRSLYHHEVISLVSEGVMEKRIKAEGITVHSINLSKKNLFRSLLKVREICKNFDIINTWLYHADFFGFIVAKILLSNKKLIWNIRHSNLDKHANKSLTLKIMKMNSLLSRYVNCITFNSNEALLNHVKVGYAEEKSLVIPNGFELDKFKFNQEDRMKVRKGLSLHENDKVFITVGRWHVQKDYHTLMKALHELKLKKVEFKFLMVGTNLENSNKELVALITKYNLINDVFLLGRRNDIPALLSAADVYVSSSIGESFSNAIGEAMASELHCVVTDVGDSKMMIGETGKIVNPRDHFNMALELMYFINRPEIERNRDARERVIERYEVQSVVNRLDGNFSKI